MTRSQWIVIGGLTLTILVIFGLFLYQSLTPYETTPALEGTIAAAPEITPTALEAYALAREAVAQNGDDLYLVSVSRQLALSRGRIVRTGVWGFRFFSPANNHLYVVSVEGNEARLLQASLSPVKPSPISDEAWQVDSEQALRQWWQRYGGQSSRRVWVTLVLHLGISEQGHLPVWTIAGLGQREGEQWILNVNASTGEMLASPGGET
ncbi:MAG: hypothetical protein D6759_12635 [Chloroflexi bacterium]|nr:MAG: hypothetical protein D6759_12635 [Chloroflexota bacterium]